MSTLVCFDPDAVRRLVDDDEDLAFARSFVACYLKLLPQRVRRVAQALDGDDLDDTRDAVLSLTVSAATVGALELAELGRDLDRLVCEGDRVRAITAAIALTEVADRVASSLEEFLASWS
ncbi:hypothetical protein ABLE68_16675 [Nocardioides sp. CN2-186]|uniref:hypothetical protein n=1 Tax=Nocardioides tweenelious TaxID=3156607 RepID=UPI0032B4A401